jgi:hypothetical protein
MKRIVLAGLLAALGISSAYVPVPASGLDRNYSCILCHSDKKNQFFSGIHYKRNILCEDCHGGDAGAMDESAHARSAGFKSDINDDKKPFSKKEIVKLCASCHSDARKMLQYGIPSNQEELYRISMHGRALFGKNDENVAVCTDCHGVHQILPPSDPRSKVYISNLPVTCASCHADKELMKRYGLPWDIFDEFRKSVHGRALVEKNDTRSPNCANCHGVHGATPPQVNEIENVCGKCHDKTKEYFNAGPHREAMIAQGLGECVSCHGDHDVRKASLDLFDEVCIDCHDASSGAFRRGQSIKALVVEAAGTIDDVREQAREAARNGIDITPYEQDLIEAETNLIRTAPVTHSLSVAEVEKLARSSMAIAEDVKLELFHKHEELQERKFILIVVWGFLAMVIPVTVIKRYRTGRKLRDEK